MSGHSKKRVFIVEDENQFRYSISLALKSEGILVGEAADGLKALRLLKQAQKLSKNIDLLILDLQLPRLSGFDLIDELRRLNIHIPTLIITGNIKKSQARDLKEKGCIGLLHKPFNPDQLIKRINAVFNESASESATV